VRILPPSAVEIPTIVVSSHPFGCTTPSCGHSMVTPRGARLLYVAMTRAVQELHLVTEATPPAVLDSQ
jgi:hypothetical protein